MGTLKEIFGVDKPLIAMCHLAALPGRPRHDAAGGIELIVDRLARDLVALQRARVDGVLFCNENDLPYQLKVSQEASSAMAATVSRLLPQITVPFGIDLLWDPVAALAVARATGASFVREVMTGVFDSDMGLMAPDLGEIARYRHAIGADDVALFANITPEFSRSVSGRSVAERAKGAAFMGVDALLISGSMAGVTADLGDLKEAKAAVDHVPVLANTGVTHDNVQRMLAMADGVIVGTSLKLDGSTWNPVDPDRVLKMMELVSLARRRADVA